MRKISVYIATTTDITVGTIDVTISSLDGANVATLLTPDTGLSGALSLRYDLPVDAVVESVRVLVERQASAVGIFDIRVRAQEIF